MSTNSMNWIDLWKKFLIEFKLDLILPYPEPKTSIEEWTPIEECINAHFMLIHIIGNKRKKKPDWDNSDEIKYSGWFDMRKTVSGSGFSVSDFVFWATAAHCGSRLCIPDDWKLMKEIISEYEPIYEKFIKE